MSGQDPFDGASPRLVVRRSAIHGMGVFAEVPLAGRRKLGELTGRLAALPAARLEVEGNDRIYLVELDEAWALDCREGNGFRHLNHRCRPNSFLRIVGHRIEVYTLRAIPAGTELTVDYGVTPHLGGMNCTCGDPGCRGIL